MRFREFVMRWYGIFLVLVACVSSIWLASTGQLNLYIHPRYIVFTTCMAAIGLALGFLSFRYMTKSESDEKSKKHWPTAVRTSAIVALCAVVFIGLIIIQPATLTSSSHQRRGVNQATDTSVTPSTAVSLFGNSDYTSFTVKDWSSLLTQTTDSSFFKNKSADIVGFISPDSRHSKHTFYVSRFVITCCAVDALPIGVPVHVPDWQHSYTADTWVRIRGTFVPNPDHQGKQPIVMQPTKINTVAQPKDPYVY